MCVATKSSGNRLAMIFMVVVAFVATIVGLYFLAIVVVNFRVRSVTGNAKDATDFMHKLQIDDVHSSVSIPDQSNNVSYFLQPNMGRFYIEASTNESNFIAWATVSSTTGITELSEPREVRWLDRKGQPRSMNFSDGLHVQIDESGEAMFSRNLNRFFYWEAGVSH